MKKSIIIELGIILLIVLFIAGYVFLDNYKEEKIINDAENNIRITMGNSINKVDMKYNSDLFKVYKKYPYHHYFEYYYCVLKVENNSKLYVYDVNIREPYKYGQKWTTDFDSGLFYNCSIPPDSVEYVAIIISVDKNITDDELNSIPEELSNQVIISIGEDNAESDGGYVNKMVVKYELTDEDYSKYDFIYSVGLLV